MPKVSFRKEYNKPPIVIFKYDNSKSYYLRFYVDKKYKSNGCEERSLGRHIKTLREAEQKSKEIWREFFKNYTTNDFINEIDFHKDIAKPYLERIKKKYEHDNKPQYYRKTLNRYDRSIKPYFEDIDYRNKDSMNTAIEDLFFDLDNQQLSHATQLKYKDILNQMFKKALNNNDVPFNQIPDFPKLDRNFKTRRESYEPKEQRKIIDRFLELSKQKENPYYDEVADYLEMLRSAGFRPGTELLKVKRSQLKYIPRPSNPKFPILQIRLIEHKKNSRGDLSKVHHQSINDYFTYNIYEPRMKHRYPKSNDFDYVFFPKLKNRQSLYDKIRKDFVRVSRELGLYLLTDTPRPLYTFRHTFINQRERKGVASNVVAIHSNTHEEMIRKYYKSQSEYQIALDHENIFPESKDFIQKLEKQTTKNQNKKSDK
tara:strand:+ start:457 stop:1737 length:1281 start_codon:yes stop_codon:yes gene_type:complete